MFKIIGGDGEEYGPVDNADVRQWIQEGRANAQTMLKREGQAKWAPLSDYPEFSPLLGGPTGQSMPTSTKQSMLGSVGQPVSRGTVPNYLVHSILVTVFCGCSLPFGIVAIIHASKVDTYLTRGDHAAAVAASESAKTWCILALVFAIMGPLILFTIAVWADTL